MYTWQGVNEVKVLKATQKKTKKMFKILIHVQINWAEFIITTQNL